MSPFFQKSRQAPHLKGSAKGFVLLEVLVAMSIVAGSWVALEGSYHRLVLRMAQIQAKKAVINRERDQYEAALFAAMQSNKPNSKVALSEPSGVSSRSRVITRAGGSLDKK